ncbi:protein ST7 homolog isoform X2 [Plutella xylostella]|uniref:protein ST7 homolog isoform X2 n=1 Tax=Plutella xylostella TaxID=51655 RepID=UPI002032DDDA|nr:protein ST7 homolog isoform X2 [Plutella xylostella]
MWDSSSFLSALTPKFYVALTGTSSLISGLILIFEWWYFRKYGTSFIEQVSIGPWLGSGSNGESAAECKVWRNPLSLLRGAEYARLWAEGRAPLTYYDMNLSAQEHQSWFCAGGAGGAGEGGEEGVEACMARAWRERSPGARVAAARTALSINPECAPALLLLAEEDAPTVQEAERVLRRALRCAEAACKTSSAVANNNSAAADRAKRDAAVLAHVKRRLAMCARRLGRLKDATRMFRELARDAPPALTALALHENLIEVLLEQKAYADVQAVLARYDDISLPKSATICYTAALLRARAASIAASAGPPGAGAARAAECAAAEAMRRAVEFNPHVPDYLLELRALTLPPEHLLKRGDSEAVAYAFFHLRHWRSVPGALRLLAETAACGARAALFHPYPSCTACADRELLPPQHSLSVFPRRAPALLPAAAALCTLTAALALAAHRWPEPCAAAAAAAARAAREMHPGKLLQMLVTI